MAQMPQRIIPAALLILAGISNAWAQDEFAAVRDKIQACVACHGEGGASTSPQYPIIAGQEEYYLYVQLKDFKSGLRKNDLMQPLVSLLDIEQMKLIARYFSRREWPHIGHRASDANVRVAEVGVNAGECVSCHLGDFKGNSRVPRLAGQYPEYLSKTMLDFKNGGRGNAQDKSALFKTFSEQDIGSLADYLGSLVVYRRSGGAEIR